MSIAQRLEQKGIEIGIELGRLTVMLKVVRNMRQNGMDDVAVMKLTGLTKEELAKLG